MEKQMSAKKVPATPVAPNKVKYVDGPQYVSSYCNNVAFAVNAVDLVLIFGEVVDVVGEEAIVERRARITYTPAQAKMLQWVIAEQIKQYEANNGPIVVPQGIRVAIEERKKKIEGE
jgi:hypothetical protein